MATRRGDRKLRVSDSRIGGEKANLELDQRSAKRLPVWDSLPDAGVAERMRAFSVYARGCSDEKGDAQVFCDRLFRAFGHDGYKEAGAILEDRVKVEGKTRFADLVWKPRAVIEMKKRGEKLSNHYAQLLNYWLYSTPNRPRYALLCNFHEFWIYDFDQQMDEPVDRVALDDLADRYDALNFLFPEERKPAFRNNRTAVTDGAAKLVAGVYKSLVARGEPKDRAQRFTLQCVVAMFAEDTGLLPRGLFSELVSECLAGASSYDLLGGLFNQMNNPKAARGGRFKLVRYFNGGIFAVVDPIELEHGELETLRDTCAEHWGRINPAIFGTLFQDSMGGTEQHKKGAHYTPESEIMRVVLPTIVRPLREQLLAAESLRDLKRFRETLTKVRILDPACGSGNFLYVAYRELKRLELTALEKIHENFAVKARRQVGHMPELKITQFFGIDNDPFAVELAKVTMVLAKKLAIDEQQYALDTAQAELDIGERPLPLENLDKNILHDDALFCQWPSADLIIGNPPYQSKNKAQGELSPAYMSRVRKRYKAVPGHADYCVYWFRRAHDELPEGGRAGLVGTKTIRQTNSRRGGLDHIVENGGTITEAVSSQIWPGRAVLHVSIVNWIKGDQPGKKTLAIQEGDHRDSPWRSVELDRIPSSLSDKVDVTSAIPLKANKMSGHCFQGQTPGQDPFVLSREDAVNAVADSAKNAEVLFPYITGDEILSGAGPDDWRYVIDFSGHDQLSARKYKKLFERVRREVLPAREKAAKEEQQRNAEVLADDPKARVNKHHANFLKKWWQLSYARARMIARLEPLPRYIVCSRVTRRPVFSFLSGKVHPSDGLSVFALTDDYSFGIFQSNTHWLWFRERGLSLKGDPRYTSTTVFDTFPWPQKPTRNQVASVASASAKVREVRAKVQKQHGVNLRVLYATLEDPGDHPLRTAQERLDVAVRAAYGMADGDDELAFILALNKSCAEREARGEEVRGPGSPTAVKPSTTDCLEPPSGWS